MIEVLGAGWAAILPGMEAIFFNPTAWLLVFIGVTLGMVVGVLPGFGPPAAMALLFPLVYRLEALPGLALLAGIFYGAKYGGAVTSILLGIPGEADAVATLLEGHPLAKKGQAQKALRVAILSSFCGSMLAICGLVLLAPFLSGLALLLGPGGRGLLMLAALGLVCFLGQGDRRKSLLMACLGLILALVGLDPVHGSSRLSFGFWQWNAGIDLSALLLGFFGLGDILDNLLHPTPSHNKDKEHAEEEAAQPFQLGQTALAAVRGSAIGFGVGLVPSGAGVTASFASYSLEKRLSPRPESFGKGQWSGLAGPEAANNAAAVSSFAPLFLLGLPTNPVMAAMLGAMTVGGVVPGPGMPLSQPGFYWGFLFSLTLGNLLLLGAGLGLAPLWAALARVPFRLLWPVILVLCLSGSWLAAGGPAGPAQCLFFGVLSAFLRRRGFPPAPLVLALVLGRALETHLIQAVLSF